MEIQTTIGEIDSILGTLKKQPSQAKVLVLVEDTTTISGEKLKKALEYGKIHKSFNLNYSENRMTRDEMNER